MAGDSKDGTTDAAKSPGVRLGIENLCSDAPEDVRAWLRSCWIVFATAESTPTDSCKVALTMNTVHSPLLAAFVDSDLDRLLLLSWDKFSTALIDHETGVPFAQYAASVCVVNVSLPKASQLSDKRLKELLEANARPVLCARIGMYGDISDKPWAEFVALWKIQDKLMQLEAVAHKEEESLTHRTSTVVTKDSSKSSTYTA
ncbi:hypothetical protein BDV93DRAFT_566752 [Ceratobasidium sp. AG-I]|nr:hypothetical protein BDV93DRAFT_566752 [Ceratobasidium sp. AG-I]